MLANGSKRLGLPASDVSTTPRSTNTVLDRLFNRVRATRIFTRSSGWNDVHTKCRIARDLPQI
eukprot:4233310-Alexandrium_andersonii.AAC.1